MQESINNIPDFAYRKYVKWAQQMLEGMQRDADLKIKFHPDNTCNNVPGICRIPRQNKLSGFRQRDK